MGEEIDNLLQATDIIKSDDLLVVVGTTLQVYPAANLLLVAPLDAETIYIDSNPVIE